MPPELLQLLQTMMQQRVGGGTGSPTPAPAAPAGFDILGLLKATDPDPVGTANRLSGLPSTAPGSQSPFTTGFFNPENSAASLTPEARLASQGNNAMNQWAQLGGMTGVDPTALAKMNAGAAAVPNAGPPMSGFGAIEPPPVQPTLPGVGSWLGNPTTGFDLVGPKNPTEGGGFILDSIPGVGRISPNETATGILNPPKKRRKPFSAGASANPSPGFAY